MFAPCKPGWYAARNAAGVLRTVLLFPESGHVYLPDAEEPLAAADWQGWSALADSEPDPATRCMQD